MDLDIQKLIDSEYGMLSNLGWMLYNRMEQSGLNQEEVYELMKIINEEEMTKEYQAAYDEGFNDGVCG